MQENKSPRLQQMAALGIARIAAKGLQSKQGSQQSLTYSLLTACLDAYIPASGGHSVSHCLCTNHSAAADEPHGGLHSMMWSPDCPQLALPAFKLHSYSLLQLQC